jgi:hypothetical protein
MKSVNLAEKLSLFCELFKPRTVGQFNGHDLMVAKAEGRFVWHKYILFSSKRWRARRDSNTRHSA